MSKTEKENKKLLKSLGVNTRNLHGYNKLYGTTPNTLGYKDSSMWAYSIHGEGVVEVNTTYFEKTEQIVEHNKRINKC